jgi:hypothetical protein
VAKILCSILPGHGESGVIGQTSIMPSPNRLSKYWDVVLQINVASNAPSSFDLTAAPQARVVVGYGGLSQQGLVQVSVSHLSGTPQPVCLTASGLPKGIIARWHAWPCAVPTFTKTLTLYG